LLLKKRVCPAFACLLITDFGKHQMPNFYFANRKKPVAQDANFRENSIKKANTD
jgi:hypothetical protein